MRRLAALLALLALVGLVAGAVLVVRPSLADDASAVDDRWETVAEALTGRYDALAVLADEIDHASDSRRAVVDEVREELDAWWRSVDQAAGTEAQVVVANSLEGLAARLVATIDGSSRLAGDEAVVQALEALTAAVVPAATVESYNEAVRRYDDRRRSITGQPVATLFGFDARTAYAPVTAPGEPEAESS